MKNKQTTLNQKNRITLYNQQNFEGVPFSGLRFLSRAQS